MGIYEVCLVYEARNNLLEDVEMRREFAELLYKAMQEDPDIYLITGDLGYGMWDQIKNMFPERYINVGAAEQTMVGIASGLAFEGKKPFCYSITPFLLYRPFEHLRTYVNHEKIPVRLIGSGRNQDYEHDGYSHWADDAQQVLSALPNIKRLFPKDEAEVKTMFKEMLETNGPSFISLKR